MLFLIRRYLLIKKQVVFNWRNGRYKINKKLGLNLPKDITYLTAHDFIGIIDGTELKYYDRVNDDIDDIKINKLDVLANYYKTKSALVLQKKVC
jgi:hypothetical protein